MWDYDLFLQIVCSKLYIEVYFVFFLSLLPADSVQIIISTIWSSKLLFIYKNIVYI